MDNYRKHAISDRMTTSLGKMSKENTKPFRDDGLIEHIHYIEAVGFENLPEGYIEFFREKYGSKSKDRKVTKPFNRRVKGYSYPYIHNYWLKYGIAKTERDLNIARSTIYIVNKVMTKGTEEAA